MTEEVKFPLGNIYSILQTLRGSNVFSQIDLRSAYQSVPIAEEDQKKCSIITEFGQFQSTRLFFGLKNAPSSFSYVLKRVLQGITNTVNYLDDLVIYSNSFRDHWRHLKACLQRLFDCGLKINLNKSTFFIAVLFSKILHSYITSTQFMTETTSLCTENWLVAFIVIWWCKNK